MSGMEATLSSDAIESLFRRQLETWNTARRNYEALGEVKVKSLKVGKANFKVQYNPARITSSSAKVDKTSIGQRACFLCEKNRPTEQEGIRWRDYTVIVNPYPIFPRHLTIPTNTHTAQRIISRIGDMMSLAFELKEFIIFYNGPKCGASAPDHLHFQAGIKGVMTYDTDLANADMEFVKGAAEANLSVATGLGRVAYLINTKSIEAGKRLFNDVYECLPKVGEDEPMLNVLCWWNENDGWTIAMFPRRKHRPDRYYAEGDERWLISPASVDLGGVFITPLEQDFQRISATDIQEILNEVCITEKDAKELINDIR